MRLLLRLYQKNKLFKSNDITEVEAEGSVNTEELETSRDTPYKKPDYKKRYDDLKKHYDSHGGILPLLLLRRDSLLDW